MSSKQDQSKRKTFCAKDIETYTFEGNIIGDVIYQAGEANDRNHRPQPIHVSTDLTTLDLRHFIWNIAERLQLFGADYSCTARGTFIKCMFPDICRNAEAEYLGENLTHKPNEGFIRLDKPDRGMSLFHQRKA